MWDIYKIIDLTYRQLG